VSNARCKTYLTTLISKALATSATSKKPDQESPASI
jgi:hypothetical protein